MERFRNFISRHRRKFLVGGLLVAGTTLALRYAQRRLREYQEEQIKEFLEKQRRVQHFESTERTCDQAIIGLAPGVCENIMKLLDTDQILQKLRSETETDVKMELWNTLKVLAFSRVVALVYGISLLETTLRIQLNIMGGYIYKDTVNSEANLSPEVQTMYSLQLIQYLMKEGLDEFIGIIRENVEKTMKKHDLKEHLTLGDIEQLFWSIQAGVNRDVNRNFVRFILPTEKASHEIEILQKMLLDTLDVLESDEFNEILEGSITSSFSIVIDKIAEFYFQSSGSKNKNQLNGISNGPSTSKSADLLMRNGSAEDLVNINHIGLPLAKIIPIVNGLTTLLPSSNTSDIRNKKNLAATLLTMLLVNQNVKTLGLNVYEVYCR
jgi:peroxin-3